MTQATHEHSPEKILLDRWTSQYHTLQCTSDITEFTDSIRSLIGATDTEPSSFQHPLWSVLQNYDPHSKYCSVAMIEYHLWIQHESQWTKWATTTKWEVFWQPLFAHIDDVHIQSGLFEHERSITNLTFRLKRNQFKRTEWIVMRLSKHLRDLFNNLSEHTKNLYTWLIVVPAWLFHYLLLAVHCGWEIRTDSDSVNYKLSQDIFSPVDLIAQAFNNDHSWLTNALYVLGFALFILVVAVPVCIALYGVVWSVIGIMVYGVLMLFTIVPIEFMDDNIQSKRLKRFLKISYSLICGTVALLALMYGSLKGIGMILSEILIEHRKFNYVSMDDLDAVVVQLWTLYPNLILNQVLRGYLLFGGFVWALLLILSLDLLKELPIWIKQYKGTLLSIPTNIDRNHRRRFINHYCAQYLKSSTFKS